MGNAIVTSYDISSRAFGSHGAYSCTSGTTRTDPQISCVIMLRRDPGPRDTGHFAYRDPDALHGRKVNVIPETVMFIVIVRAPFVIFLVVGFSFRDCAHSNRESAHSSLVWRDRAAHELAARVIGRALHPSRCAV
jgi:hypothetical protein